MSLRLEGVVIDETDIQRIRKQTQDEALQIAQELVPHLIDDTVVAPEIGPAPLPARLGIRLWLKAVSGLTRIEKSHCRHCMEDREDAVFAGPMVMVPPRMHGTRFLGVGEYLDLPEDVPCKFCGNPSIGVHILSISRQHFPCYKILCKNCGNRKTFYSKSYVTRSKAGRKEPVTKYAHIQLWMLLHLRPRCSHREFSEAGYCKVCLGVRCHAITGVIEKVILAKGLEAEGEKI